MPPSRLARTERSSLPRLASAAAGHMHMIADPLAETIVKQFPDRFGG